MAMTLKSSQVVMVTGEAWDRKCRKMGLTKEDPEPLTKPAGRYELSTYAYARAAANGIKVATRLSAMCVVEALNVTVDAYDKSEIRITDEAIGARVTIHHDTVTCIVDKLVTCLIVSDAFDASITINNKEGHGTLLLHLKEWTHNLKIGDQVLSAEPGLYVIHKDQWSRLSKKSRELLLTLV